MTVSPRELVDWIEIPSTSGGEGDYGDAVVRALEARGFAVERWDVGAGRFDVLARAGRPEVVFCTHLDTVPPHFGGRVEGGAVHGRGACDAKGQLAAMLTAAEALVADGEDRVGFLLTVGEEVDSDGASAADRRLAESPALRDRWAPRWTIVGEPTDNRFVAGHKGLFKARLVATGELGHSSRPTGPSAIHELVGCCSRLLATDWGEHALLGPGTVNFGTIAGGHAANVVADHAEAEVLVRAVDGPDSVRARLDAALGERVRVVEEREQYGPVEFHVPEGEESVAVAFGTDAPHLTHWGTPLLFGAGSIELAHTDHERVAVRELEDCAARHVRTVRELLARADAEGAGR